MEDIRINKISVDTDKKNDETIISLRKNNQLLGIINCDDLEIESYANSGVSLKAYRAYVEDVVINLIDNGGLPGYYYEPKQDNDGIKYDNGSFLARIKEYAKNIIKDKYRFSLMQDSIDAERYNNGFIKNASAKFVLILQDYDIRIILLCNIKSGQVCRPRVMLYDGEEYSFNITSINRIVKANQ